VKTLGAIVLIALVLSIGFVRVRRRVEEYRREAAISMASRWATDCHNAVDADLGLKNSDLMWADTQAKDIDPKTLVELKRRKKACDDKIFPQLQEVLHGKLN
jgi:hypothetical protein